MSPPELGLFPQHNALARPPWLHTSGALLASQGVRTCLSTLGLLPEFDSYEENHVRVCIIPEHPLLEGVFRPRKFSIHRFLCGHFIFSFLFDKYVGMDGILGKRVSVCLILQGSIKLFSRVVAPFCIPSGGGWDFMTDDVVGLFSTCASGLRRLLQIFCSCFFIEMFFLLSWETLI